MPIDVYADYYKKLFALSSQSNRIQTTSFSAIILRKSSLCKRVASVLPMFRHVLASPSKKLRFRENRLGSAARTEIEPPPKAQHPGSIRLFIWF
ncbi:MAG TPA: hypothetical protein DDZ51_22325 [Planctomycetaceae bacterium]|nr:hypothetical protein [Planctomycetaceae bacterium]